MITTILFDAYGTLISTGTGSVDAAQQILLRNDRPDISAKAFYARWKQLHRAHMDMPGEFSNEEALFRLDLRRLYAEYRIPGNAEADVKIMLGTLGRRTAFPETRAVLDALAERYTICIASTTDTTPLLQDLQRSRLFVHHVFTSESLRCYKPSPAFYQGILSTLQICAGETLFVGDSLTDDVLGPQRAGIRACWLNRMGAKSTPVVPDFEISDLRQLNDLLARME